MAEVAGLLLRDLRHRHLGTVAGYGRRLDHTAERWHRITLGLIAAWTVIGVWLIVAILR